MVDWFAPAFGSGNTYLEIFLRLILSDEVGQAPGSKTGIERRVLDTGFTRYNTSYGPTPSEKYK
jgi:hypothetical protein